MKKSRTSLACWRIKPAIGVAEPVSVFVDTFGTNMIPEDEISRRVRANFDLTPHGIIQLLDLTRPIYSQTAKNGHFGHPEFGWEKTDQAGKLAS